MVQWMGAVRIARRPWTSNPNQTSTSRAAGTKRSRETLTSNATTQNAARTVIHHGRGAESGIRDGNQRFLGQPIANVRRVSVFILIEVGTDLLPLSSRSCRTLNCLLDLSWASFSSFG